MYVLSHTHKHDLNKILKALNNSFVNLILLDFNVISMKNFKSRALCILIIDY